jgi:hypothetical protein
VRSPRPSIVSAESAASSLGLRGTLLLIAGISVLGALLTLVLPEPSGRSLEEISGEAEVIAAEDAIRDAEEPAPATR